LFAELGYRQVWHKLIAGLGTLLVADPSDNALWQAERGEFSLTEGSSWGTRGRSRADRRD
jgi:hypothetical protein